MEIMIGLLIGAAVSATLLKAASKMVYRKTGYNGLKGLPKLLMYVEGVALLAAIGYLESNSIPVPFLVIGILVSLGLFTLANRKAGLKYALILSVIQAVCGGLVALVMVVGFALKLFTGGKASGLGNLFTINESEINTVQQATMDNINRVNSDAIKAKEQNNMQADAFAQKKGFVDADEAEAAGIKTGKQY